MDKISYNKGKQDAINEILFVLKECQQNNDCYMMTLQGQCIPPQEIIKRVKEKANEIINEIV